MGPVDKLVRRDASSGTNDDDASTSLSGTYCACDGFSVVTSRTRRGDSHSVSAFGNEADREQERRLLAEKKMKKRQLLDSINRIVSDEMRPALIEEDGSDVFGEGFNIVEDPSKLMQEISQLKARLKQKKTQRLAIMNDIVDSQRRLLSM